MEKFNWHLLGELVCARVSSAMRMSRIWWINLLSGRGGLSVAMMKLVDFGTSKLQSAEMGSGFKIQNIGTRTWMAPEVIKREGDEIKPYTWSADVYSFGMTCYKIITCNLPFHILMVCQLPKIICEGPPPYIPDDCPDGLKELMKTCWAHTPEDRPTFKNIWQKLWNL